MTEHVRITDVSPRDGLQNEPGVVPTADKVKLIELLAAAGVDEIEATSFVSPKWVPQLGDAAEVLAALRDVYFRRDGNPSPPLPPSGRGGKSELLTPALSRGETGEEVKTVMPVLSVLVPNEKGYERALAFHCEQFSLKIALFTAASQTFNKKNTNATIEESIERFGAFLPDAIGRGMAVRLYVSCAIACPYEGRIEAAVVRGVCDQLLSMVPADALQSGDVELDLGDTIGAATPADIEKLLAKFTADERSRLTLHLHDTFGRAGDCVKTALEMGVRSFDGSVAGLGGCPYAGTKDKPAPGNISTESLVKLIDEAGYETRVNPSKLTEAAAFARAIVGTARGSAGITPL